MTEKKVPGTTVDDLRVSSRLSVGENVGDTLLDLLLYTNIQINILKNVRIFFLVFPDCLKRYCEF